MISRCPCDCRSPYFYHLLREAANLVTVSYNSVVEFACPPAQSISQHHFSRHSSLSSLVNTQYPLQIRLLLVPVAVAVYQDDLYGCLEVIGRNIEGKLQRDLPLLFSEDGHRCGLVRYLYHFLFDRLDHPPTDLQHEVRPLLPIPAM